MCCCNSLNSFAYCPTQRLGSLRLFIQCLLCPASDRTLPRYPVQQFPLHHQTVQPTALPLHKPAGKGPSTFSVLQHRCTQHCTQHCAQHCTQHHTQHCTQQCTPKNITCRQGSCTAHDPSECCHSDSYMLQAVIHGFIRFHGHAGSGTKRGCLHGICKASCSKSIMSARLTYIVQATRSTVGFSSCWQLGSA